MSERRNLTVEEALDFLNAQRRSALPCNWPDCRCPDFCQPNRPPPPLTITTDNTAPASRAAAEARIAELEGALTELQSFVVIMCSRGPDATIPETVASPLGPAIKIGDIMRSVAAALAAPQVTR